MDLRSGDMVGARARAPFRRAAGTAIPAGMLTAGHPHLDFSGPCQLAAARTKMSETDKTICLNSLFMDFATEAELELFLKSIDEVWTADLYDRLSAAGLIRHVVSKVWNKDQYRISMVFEYDSREGFEACEKIIATEFGETRRKQMDKFVFKIFNNRGVVLSEFAR